MTEYQNDSELYNNYLAGDAGAYDQLMIRHGDSLTFYLYGYLHDWHAAEDLMIEAFARLMVKRPKIGDGCFKAYLFKTGRNLAYRYHSRKTRHQEFSFDDYYEDTEGREMVEEMVMDEERQQVLRACLDRIDPQLREALWLVYSEGLKYAEAATVMGVNAKRVDHLLSRGKKQMREELKKEGVLGAYA